MSQSQGSCVPRGAKSLPLGCLIAALLFFVAAPVQAQERAPGYRVQVAAQDAMASAAEVQQTVARQLGGDFAVHVVEAGGLFKVRVGDFITKAEASALLGRVRGLGYSDAWIAADQVALASAAGGGGQPGVDRQPEPAEDRAQAEASRVVRPAPAPERVELQPAGAPDTAAPDEEEAEVARANPESANPVEGEVFPAPRPESEVSERGMNRSASGESGTVEDVAASWPLVDDGAIRVDGQPTERAWERAGSGWAKRPSSANSSTPATSVQFAYDNRAFYVATQVSHSRSSTMEAGMSEAPGDQERVVVTIRRDGVAAASFGVTLTGVRVRYDDAWDREQEQDWQARTATQQDGWSSEIRVPFELLGVDERSASEPWEVSVRWEDPKGAPSASRQDMPMEQFALVFSTPGAGMGRLVIAPFYQASTAVATASPSWESPTSRVGGEIRADFGEAFQAAAQVQPDYINTRPDPARVNLSPYETRFTEHRAFFRGLEADDDAWAPSWGPSLFYSRRIGAAPAGVGFPSSVESLQPTDVLGVAAFRGETDRVSYRAVASMNRATSMLIPSGTGTPVSVDLSPQSFLGATRVQHRVSDAATIGAAFTGVHRSMAPGDALSSFLVDQAVAGMVDLDLGLSSAGRMKAFAGFSHLAGSASALQWIQTGAGHYLQRPDADHLSVDPTATSMTGFTAGLSTFVEHSGVRLGGRAVAMNPEYDIRDAGYMRAADRIEADAWLGLGHDLGRQDGRPVGLEVGAFSSWDFGGVRLQTSPAARLLVGVEGWEGQASFRYDLEGLSADLTRGGPLMATPVGWLAAASLQREDERGVLRATGEYGTDDLDGSRLQARVMGSAEVQPGFSMWLEPGFFTVQNPRQYVMALVGGPAATYGQRYVFGELDRTEVFARIGFDVQMRYGLTLTGYAEPFVSSGSFQNFGELTAAQANDLLVYGTNGTTISTGLGGEHTVDVGGSQFTIPASDFNVRSFRTQVSLGWAPMEGALVSLAWLQSRSAFVNQYATPGVGNLLDSIRDFGSHLFVARVGYELGLPR